MRVATLSGVAAVSASGGIGVCIRYVNAIYEVIGRSCESEKPNFSWFPVFLLDRARRHESAFIPKSRTCSLTRKRFTVSKHGP